MELYKCLLLFSIVIVQVGSKFTFSQFGYSESNHLWHPYILDTGVGNREELEVDGKIVPVSLNEQVTKWIIIGGKTEKLIGAGINFILLRSLNADVDLVTCNGSIVGVASVQDEPTDSDVVIVGLQNAEDYSLVSFLVHQSTLEKQWEKRISHRVEFLKCWQRSIVTAADSTLTLVGNQTELSLQDSVEVGGRVQDLAILQLRDAWFAVLAVPQLDQIIVYQLFNKIGDGSISLHARIKSHGGRVLAPFTMGSSSFLAVAGDKEAELWRFTSDLKHHNIISRHSNISHWLPVPLHNYRKDVLLLAQTHDGAIQVFKPHGFSQFRLAGNLSQICPVEQENCRKLSKEMRLSDSVASLERILVPISPESGFWLEMSHRLEEIPSQAQLAVEQLNQLESHINVILDNQNKEATQFVINDNLVFHPNRTNHVSGNWTVDVINMVDAEFQSLNDDDRFDVEDWSFGGREDWSEEDMKTDLKEMSQWAELVSNQLQSVGHEVQQVALNGHTPSAVTQLPSFVDSGLTVEGHIFVDQLLVGRINSQPATSWIHDCFRVDNAGLISGKKSAESVETVSLLLNSLDHTLASHLVFDKSHLTITGDLLLESDVTVSGDVVLPPEGTVNQHHLKNHLFIPNHDVSSSGRFESVVILGGLQVGEMALPSEEESLILPAHLSVDEIDGNAIMHASIDHVIVKSQLSPTYVNGVLLNLLLPSSQQQEISMESLTTEYLNGHKFPEQFVQASDASPLLFTGNVTFQDLHVRELQTDIHGFLDLINGSQTANKKANQDMDDGMIVYVFDDVEVEPIIRADYVNLPKQDLKDSLAKRRCRRSVDSLETNYVDEQEELENAAFDFEHVHVVGSITTRSGEIAGYSTSKLNRYLSRSADQRLPLSLFDQQELLLAYNVTTTMNLNYKQQQMIRLLNITQPLKVDLLTFLYPVDVDHLVVGGAVSDVNLEDVYNDSVLTSTENTEVRGRKHFSSNLIVDYLNVHSVNGRRPSSLATRQSDNIFVGPVVMKGRVHIANNLHIAQLINQVNLTKLLVRISPSFAAFLAPGPFELASGARVDHLRVDGLINGKSLGELLEDAAFKDNNIVFTSSHVVFFKDVTMLGDLRVFDGVNGLELSALLNDLVLVNRAASLQHLTLARTSVMTHMNVTDDTTVSLVDGCDVTVWRHEAIPINQFVYGTSEFEDVTVFREVAVDVLNNRSVGSLIPLATAQSIPALVNISQLTVLQYINVHHLVNNQHLPSLFKDSLKNNGNQNITGSKRFSSNVTIEGSVHVSSVSGRPISDLITLQHSQNITSSIRFKNYVQVRKHLFLSGLLDGIQLSEWDKRAFLPKEVQVVNGSWTVNGTITARGYIGGSGPLLLEQAKQHLDEKLEEQYEQMSEMQAEYVSQCERISHISNSTRHDSRNLLDTFHQIQAISFRHIITSVIHFENDGEQYMVETLMGRCFSTIYRWSMDQNKFVRIRKVKMGPVLSWTSMNLHNGHKVLITSGPPACEKAAAHGTLWSISDDAITALARLDAFADVIANSTATNNFYTVSTNGSIHFWQFHNSSVPLTNSLIIQLPSGRYKFAPFALGRGLAVWDGSQLLQVKGSSVTQVSLAAEWVAAAPRAGLLALAHSLGPIQTYRGGHLLHTLLTSAPSHLYWIDLKAPGELYLVFASQQHTIQLFQYKGSSGLVRRYSLPYPSSSFEVVHIMGIPHIVVVYQQTIYVLQARIFGEPPINANFDCPMPT